MNNHDLLYRPLISGVSITNERIGEPGTLGYIAKDAQGGFWLVSAYHVLCNTDLSPSPGGEAIYQPAAVAPEFRVATTRTTRANANLDCAAAQVAAGVVCLNRQAGLGPMGDPIAPVVGMRVKKSGAASWVTEGVVTKVDGDDVVIEADTNFAAEYALSLPGDSGAVWVEQQSRSPVALHLGETVARTVSASKFLSVLAALSLLPM